MPSQKLINRSLRVINKLVIKILAGNALPIRAEAYNLIIILKISLVSILLIQIKDILTSGLTETL